MVLVSANLFEVDVVAEGNFMRNAYNGERDIMVKQRFAVFDGKDEVIVGIVCIVVGFDDGHGSSVYLKTNGFQTFLSGTRGKPRGKACGYFIIFYIL